MRLKGAHTWSCFGSPTVFQAPRYTLFYLIYFIKTLSFPGVQIQKFGSGMFLLLFFFLSSVDLPMTTCITFSTILDILTTILLEIYSATLYFSNTTELCTLLLNRHQTTSLISSMQRLYWAKNYKYFLTFNKKEMFYLSLPDSSSNISCPVSTSICFSQRKRF